jgi:crotonobetainyl-CoA:carnitine CoA-transferase CaiB-like acyl-CoA transferase
VKNAPGHPVAAGSPITISATPGKAQRPAPGVRERVAAVPTEKLLVAATAVARLREEGVV